MIEIPFNINYIYTLNAFIKGGWKGSFTNNNGIIKIFPSEKNFKKINISHLKFTYFQTYSLAKSLSLQINELLKYNIGFIFMQPKDIIQIDDFWYMNINLDNLTKIKDFNLIITSPLDKSIIGLAPELKNISYLPFSSSFKAIYYSIGYICLNSLPIDNDIEEINGSPIYFFIKRAMNEYIEDRFLLYI